MAVGPHSHANTDEISGTADGVQMEFTPLGAYCLLGLPLRETGGRVTVGEPARVTGRSRHRLEILFGALTGLTPTQFSKLTSTTTDVPTHGHTTSVITT